MKKFFKRILQTLVAIVVILVITAITTHRSLPTQTGRVDSSALTIQPDSLLVAHLLPQIQSHPKMSGIYPLRAGKDAFLARMALVESAQYALDVQYYIWHNDISGNLLMQALYRAAGRGVRVRLLLDDNNTAGMDEALAALNTHPNVEIRLFNPFMQRQFRPLGYLSDFFRLNRRMHNKSLTADGITTIIGGRNIGDEYFEAGTGVMFADLDILAVGQAADDVEQDFDRYWASQSAYPLEKIIPQTSKPFDSQPAKDRQTQDYLQSLAQSSFAEALRMGNLPLEWVKTTLISDDPAKGLGKVAIKDTVAATIFPEMAKAEKTLVIVSPYFVPAKQGTDFFSRIAQTGKSLTILTNSLAATDVAAVHAGYAKYRKDLLSAGAKLYELKPDATVHTNQHGLLKGSLGASLHAKTFAVDDKTLFVGSFNMDPRSAALNTEMGFLIDSPNLATELTQSIQNNINPYAYQVLQDKKGNLYWQTQEQAQTLDYHNEPNSGWFKRLAVKVCSWLPIEWLL
ncbi:Cardiolipin synthase [Suttonella ornithocola]|uniref:Cardiolipin synthase n=2 Tax=Suttonella ornithocola TaxID=279832 RepID=A0A380MYZ1_9GAMM|nr:phospholipase D family protein [Suttonella ornithocola]SUO97434.1 Cardiolipin synthase [Suttonella ornithocola]